jgi:hypothetical protein
MKFKELPTAEFALQVREFKEKHPDTSITSVLLAFNLCSTAKGEASSMDEVWQHVSNCEWCQRCRTSAYYPRWPFFD